jgi:hypothetical protein
MWFWTIAIGILLVVGAWAYWPRRPKSVDDELVRRQQRVDRGVVEQYRRPDTPGGMEMNF